MTTDRIRLRLLEKLSDSTDPLADLARLMLPHTSTRIGSRTHLLRLDDAFLVLFYGVPLARLAPVDSLGSPAAGSPWPATTAQLTLWTGGWRTLTLQRTLSSLLDIFAAELLADEEGLWYVARAGQRVLLTEGLTIPCRGPLLPAQIA